MLVIYRPPPKITDYTTLNMYIQSAKIRLMSPKCQTVLMLRSKNQFFGRAISIPETIKKCPILLSLNLKPILHFECTNIIFVDFTCSLPI